MDAASKNQSRLWISVILNVLLLIALICLPLYCAHKISGLSDNIERLRAALAQNPPQKAPQPMREATSSIYGSYLPYSRDIEGGLNFTTKDNKYYVEIKTLSKESGHTCEFSAPCAYDKEYERFECSNEGTIYLNFGRKNSLEVSEFDNPASGSWCGARMALSGFYLK